MSCPFPGMDPYLETSALWPTFHRQLVAILLEEVLAVLSDRYEVKVGERRYLVGDSESLEEESRTVAESYLEIAQRTDGGFVTLVDVVSPSNKSTPAGRQAYLGSRQHAKDGGANLVEIDLVTQGQPMLDYSREGLPDWDHSVTVVRSTQLERYEIYTATLQKRLPKFRLPLAAGERDAVIDLQQVFSRTYEQGAFAAKIVYTSNPPVPIAEEHGGWLMQLLAHSNMAGRQR